MRSRDVQPDKLCRVKMQALVPLVASDSRSFPISTLSPLPLPTTSAFGDVKNKQTSCKSSTSLSTLAHVPRSFLKSSVELLEICGTLLRCAAVSSAPVEFLQVTLSVDATLRSDCAWSHRENSPVHAGQEHEYKLQVDIAALLLLPPLSFSCRTLGIKREVEVEVAMGRLSC